MEGYTGGYKSFLFGCDMASTKRKHITGVWQSPQRGPGAEPLVRGSGGEAPPEAGAFLGPVRQKEIANLLSFVLWVLISLITVWCRQLNWRRQSFQLDGNCMFSCRSAFSWFSSILDGDNDNLKFVKNQCLFNGGGLNPLTPPLHTPMAWSGSCDPLKTLRRPRSYHWNGWSHHLHTDKLYQLLALRWQTTPNGRG